MRISFDTREKIVGAFMVIMMILLLSIVVMIGRGKDWFKTYITYYTVFDEAYNLGEDAQVKLYKADIGKVESVKLEGDKVKVELAILKDYAPRIKTDSVATVESPTLIGSEYVSIKPGTPKALPLAEKATIPSQAKKSLDDVMAEFEVEKTAKMFVKSLQAISEIVEHMRDPEGPLFASLDSMAEAMANIEAVTLEIRKGRGSVGKLVYSEDLIQQIRDRISHVNRILSNIEEATQKTPEIMDSLKESTEMINQILVNIEKGSQDVPTVTKSAKHGIKEIRDGVEEVDKVVQSAKKNFLIRPNLPPEPKGENIDAGLRR